jgi:hypothetical protein
MAPGARFLSTLLLAGSLARLPIYPTVSMVRSFGSGGDSISWGVRLASVSEHLRYEVSWAPHRPMTAFLLDIGHPLATWLAAAGLVAVFSKILVYLPRRGRVGLEVLSRRALSAALPFAVLVLGLERLLHFGLVRWPLRLVLLVLCPLLGSILALAVARPRRRRREALGKPPRPAPSPLLVRALRSSFSLALGASLAGCAFVALLVLTVPPLSARKGIGPHTWPATAALAVLASLVFRRQSSRTSRGPRTALR